MARAVLAGGLWHRSLAPWCSAAEGDL